MFGLDDFGDSLKWSVMATFSRIKSGKVKH